MAAQRPCDPAPLRRAASDVAAAAAGSEGTSADTVAQALASFLAQFGAVQAFDTEACDELTAALR